MIGPSPNSQGGIASVVTSWKSAGLFQRWPIAYLETHVEGSKGEKLRTAGVAFLRFLSLLATNRVACVHLHVARRISFWRKAIFAIVAIVGRRRILLHLHSGGFPTFFHDECNWAQKVIIRLVLKKADQLIVLSRSWRDRLGPITSNQRISVIENFVASSPREIESKSRDRHVVLFLGLLNKDKGFYDLLEAMASLRDEFPALTLACGGKGNHEEIRDLIRERRLEKNVQLLGWISDRHKEAWLSRASFFVLPSYIEGVPMGILEAMAWGLPVVSTTVGGIPDVIEHGREGLLLEPGDIAGLREAMSKLIRDDELRERMGLASREKIGQSFSAGAIVSRVDRLYETYCPS